MSVSFSLHNLQELLLKFLVLHWLFKSVGEILSVFFNVECMLSTARIYVLQSLVLVDAFVFDSKSKFQNTVLAKVSMAVASKSYISPVG